MFMARWVQTDQEVGICRYVCLQVNIPVLTQTLTITSNLNPVTILSFPLIAWHCSQTFGLGYVRMRALQVDENDVHTEADKVGR